MGQDVPTGGGPWSYKSGGTWVRLTLSDPIPEETAMGAMGSLENGESALRLDDGLVSHPSPLSTTSLDADL